MKTYNSEHKKSTASAQNLFFSKSNIFSKEQVKETPEFLLQRKEDNQKDLKTTTRIGSDGKNHLFALKDENNKTQEFEEKEKYKGEIYIPEGTQVIIKNKDTKLNGYYEVTLWYHDKYRNGFLPGSAFNNNIDKSEASSAFSAEVFIEDAKHVVYRCKTTLALSKKGADKLYENATEYTKIYLDKRNEKLTPFKNLITDIESYIQQYDSNRLIINSDILGKIAYKEQQFSKLAEIDKVEALNTAKKSIYESFNPKNEDGSTASERALIFPLSEDWFNSDESLKDYYQKNIKTTDLDKFWGESGEGMHVDADTIRVVLDLKAFIQSHQSKSLLATKEAKWLMSLEKEQLSKMKSFIFIHNDTWKLTSDNQYANGIGLETSFGPIKAHPIKTVLTHEINVNTHSDSGYLPPGLNTDSHITPEKTQKAMEELPNLNTEDMASKPDVMDAVYQSNSFISAVLLHNYFKEIRSMQ